MIPSASDSYRSWDFFALQAFTRIFALSHGIG
jgi:hypothetical protein